MLEEVIEIIADFKGIDKEEIRADSNLFMDIKFSSFQLIALLAELGENYNIDFPTKKIRDLLTPQQIVDYIQENNKEA